MNIAAEGTRVGPRASPYAFVSESVARQLAMRTRYGFAASPRRATLFFSLRLEVALEDQYRIEGDDDGTAGECEQRIF